MSPYVSLRLPTVSCKSHLPVFLFSGEGGIRTPGTLYAYDSLANCWFQPLTHLSGAFSEQCCENGSANIGKWGKWERRKAEIHHDRSHSTWPYPFRAEKEPGPIDPRWADYVGRLPEVAYFRIVKLSLRQAYEN